MEFVNIMYLRFIFTFSLLSFGLGVDRKITSFLNPGCKNCTLDTTLLYVKADGNNDTIHQIWDFTFGIPTIIFIVADLKSTVEVEWIESKPYHITISEKPTYSFAAAIDEIYEYNDERDSGYYDERDHSQGHQLEDARWRRVHSLLTEKEVMLHMRTRHWYLGTVDMKLDLLPFVDYGPELPHLIHSANSTLVDVSLVNLTGTQDYNATRFALHFLLASTDAPADTMRYVMRKSLDDEHTPGVFEIIEIKTPAAWREDCGGFLQFHPVGYTQPERGVAESTLARVSNFNNTGLPKHSTARRYFEQLRQLGLPTLAQGVFFSFGESGDGYYAAHNYTSWSFTIGYGSPPQEKFSLFVILIISLGLGVPVLLALSGVAVVLVRRRRQRHARTRFTNED